MHVTKLNSHDWQVLTLMALGLTDEEIAIELDVPQRIINRKRFFVCLKLDVPTASAAIVKAHRLGLISGSRLDC